MSEIRITEGGEDRLTESGETRILDSSVQLVGLSVTTGTDIEMELNAAGAAQLELTLSTDSHVQMTIRVQPAPVGSLVPERFYIWVYDLKGVRVDVIA